MKALTVWQPHASLIAIGAKRIETRSWSAPWALQSGSLLAIHAAKRSLSVCWRDLRLTNYAAWQEAREVLACAGLGDDLPLGAVVAVCRFVRCTFVRCTGAEYRAPHISERERLFGDYSAWRYAWELRVIYRLPDPIPARGRQGLWEWEPPEEVAEVMRLLGHQAQLVSPPRGP